MSIPPMTKALHQFVCTALSVGAALSTPAAVLSEDFANDPVRHGWRSFGDSSLFHWNAANQNLDVTWDSSHSNSFFFLPLGTFLTRSEDFSVSFDLRLSDIRLGITPGKTNIF